jgi:hypothetical protein
MEDLHKTENTTSNELVDLAVSFDNLENGSSDNFKAIKDKLIALEREDGKLDMVWLPGDMWELFTEESGGTI